MNKLGIVIVGTVSFLVISWMYHVMTFRYAMEMSFVVIPDVRTGVELADHALEVSDPLIESKAFAHSVEERYGTTVGREYFPSEQDAQGLRQWRQRVNAEVQGRILVVRVQLDDRYAAEQLLRAVANTYLKEIDEYYAPLRGVSVQIIELPYEKRNSMVAGLVLSLAGAVMASALFVTGLYLSRRKQGVNWKSAASIHKAGEELRHRLGNMERVTSQKNEAPSFSDTSIERFIHPREQGSVQESPNHTDPDHSSENTVHSENVEERESKTASDTSASRESRQDEETVLNSLPPQPSSQTSLATMQSREGSRASGVPSNLPIVSDSESGTVEEVPRDANLKEADPRFEGEPTTEEYKRRLNELLQGKMI